MMKDNKIKITFILFSTLLLIGIVGFTIAYFSDNYTFDNLFTSAIYQTTATETFTSPENWMPGDTTPKTVSVTNTGNIPVKVRISLSEHWESHNGDTLSGYQNNEKVALINLDNTDEWTKQGRFYYYNDELGPNETTSSFLQSVTFNPNVLGDIVCVENGAKRTCTSTGEGYDNATYTLTLHIETIQADMADEVWDPDDGTLYGIVKSEYKKNTTYAALYTEEHNDSYDRAATKDIYYYTTAIQNDTAQASILLDKINVLFAGYCWKMFRTTDTGGVKMIYNGLPVNGQCNSTASTTKGLILSSKSSESLLGTYYYGSDFTYDLGAGTFQLSGTTRSANYLTDKSVIGMYTCKNADVNATCTSLYYLLEEYSTDYSAYAYYISFSNTINYSSIATTPYNYDHYSFAYSGYMYNKAYKVYEKTYLRINTFSQSEYFPFLSVSLNTSYYYADSIDFVNDNYVLTNPYKVSSSSDYPNLVGKYTFNSSNQNYTSPSVRYIVGVSGNTMYYVILENGKLLSDFEPIILGESLIDNGDGTYSLNNTINVALSDWFLNYSNYEGLYTCENSQITCSSPRYLSKNNRSFYNYIVYSPSNNIVISKTRNGLNLTNTLTVNLIELLKNSDNYLEYKYTCGNDSSICTENNLMYIISYIESGFNYYPNVYFGSSATWNGNEYILNSVSGIENFVDGDSFSTHHYTCLEFSQNRCESVGFVFAQKSNTLYYILLENGVETVSDALEEMLHANDVNIKESAIKRVIDVWYAHNLLEYDTFLEETIYCNNRNITRNLAWKDDGRLDSNGVIDFIGREIHYDLLCNRETDQFSVSNNKAKLKYKVGLVTSAESLLINNSKVRSSTNSIYWTGTPAYYSYDSPNFSARNNYVAHGGSVSGSSLIQHANKESARPVISIAYGIGPSSGSGTMADPYIIDTN